LRLAQQSEDSPNVSQRVQKQLADLFAEWLISAHV
jgi:hypothetical protein